jgi:protein PhnA
MKNCELCGSKENLVNIKVAPRSDEVTLCGVCSQLDAVKDVNHWQCLADSMWSEKPAVQVLCYRILKNIEDSWARNLFTQMYLDEDLLSWAEEVVQNCVDSNGNILKDGDNVTLIKDLDVKGAGFTAKRGTLVKNIRLTDNPLHIEGKVNGIGIVLVASYLKKV